MVRNRPVDIVLVVLLAAALLTGTWYLMAMRFRSGDIYPPYSSLRTDPLGSKALHDTLEQLDPGKVRRHYANIKNLETGPGDTVFILGVRPANLHIMERDLDRLAADGARVVVAFEEHKSSREKTEKENHAAGPDEDPEETGSPEDEEEVSKLRHGPWDLEMKDSEAVADSTGKYYPVLAIDSLDLPGEISVTSSIYFNTGNEKWRVIYEFDDGPAMIERTIGQGTVLLLSDSYPVSNEALRWELYPRLISWLLAGAGDAVFLEYHLGVRETQGVMTLARKYRLITLLLSFSVVALLAVWKNAVPLVQVNDAPGQDGGHIISEKDQFTGLVSLLKRNIGTASVVQECFRQAGKNPRRKPWKAGGLKGSMTGFTDLGLDKKDPVKVYNRITEKLSERIKA